MEFTFGIITTDRTSQFLATIIEQIKFEVPRSCREIIIVGGSNPNIEDVLHIDFDESEKPMWITKKKNLITQHSTKENIVYLHDYVGFVPGWYRGQLKKGNDFSIRMDKIENFDGTRFRDWSLWPHNSNGMDNVVGRELLLPYDINELTDYMYISGTYWIAKRFVMLEYPLDEELVWGQSEDVEWSKQVRISHKFQMNEYSTVKLLKPGKERHFNEMQTETLCKALQYAKIGRTMNKIKIITPSYNNEEWVEYNIASILNQTYTNYEVLYIDDASTDNTYSKVLEAVEGRFNWQVIKNETNKGATQNYFEHLDSFVQEDDIVVHLDGDDWLYDDTVLEQLNDYYNRKDCWMSYGGFVCWNGEDTPKLPYPQSTEYSDFIHDHKLYRKDIWRASHMRTYRGSLLKALPLDALRTLEDNTYYWHASDLAFQFAYMEMCPKDKIGVVDFYTTVYNQSNQNSIRTREREDGANYKYENEIRTRKCYKEGLSGEKLPQVNVVSYFMENNNIPKDFTYVYNREDGEFDITLLTDMDIIKYVNGEIKINRGKIVADIHEAPHLLSQVDVYNVVRNNSSIFDLILTYDKDLLRIPNAIFRNGGYEVVLNKNVHKNEYPILQDDSLMQLYQDKPKYTSFITSNKVMTDGHKFRLKCVQAVANLSIPGIDFYGVGIREITGKIEGLRDYKFSVAIENGVHDNYFTEKILDCFLTGTVPIYRGCKNIGEFFDVRGFFIFDTEEELVDTLRSISDQDYYTRLEYVKENFEKAKQYAYNNDQLFNKYLRKLIEN